MNFEADTFSLQELEEHCLSAGYKAEAERCADYRTRMALEAEQDEPARRATWEWWENEKRDPYGEAHGL